MTARKGICGASMCAELWLQWIKASPHHVSSSIDMCLGEADKSAVGSERGPDQVPRSRWLSEDAIRAVVAQNGMPQRLGEGSNVAVPQTPSVHE